uniref:Uncharacterized protein n=1 Tax=Cucumis sativus TaxID=3659 RepID=A0A0A0L8R5_CUCSA
MPLTFLVDETQMQRLIRLLIFDSPQSSLRSTSTATPRLLSPHIFTDSSLKFVDFFLEGRAVQFSADQDKLEPDTFCYFKREVIDLLSQEDNVPSPPHNSQISGASPPFSDCIGPKLSHFKKEKLKTLLRQSVVTLSKEVNEMLEPARSTQRLKSYLRSKKNLEKVAMNNVKQAPFKKLKSLSSSTGLSAHEDCANLGSSMMIDDELQFFLDNYSEQIEDVVAKFSNDLSGTLGHMEQQLEEVLDSVLSNFRYGIKS